ncbi:hypothetical protein [Nonomuraea sediminis]|uniref:hypothetical protein n=1 Tax=Nonomuraea sediminis TaxID=2835864 RepID=UPI001BDD30D9|nr:hypothetical protein [Nonomuraea sediminis]
MSRRLRLVLAVGVVVSLGCLLAWRSGAVVPRLEHRGFGPEQTFVYRDDAGRPSTARATVVQMFVNDGWLPVTITGVAVKTADVSLVKATGGPIPRTLGPGAALTLELVLDVRRCDVRKGVPVLFEVDRWWGATTVTAVREDDDEPWLSALSICR